MKKKMNKKGSLVAIVLIFLAVIMIGMIGGIWYTVSKPAPASVVQPGQQSTVQQIISETNKGQISTLNLWVYDLAQNDQTTKIAVPIYCSDGSTTLIADGTVSSTSAETKVSTETGKTVTCYAFNASFVTVDPLVVTIDGESPHAVIKGYSVHGIGKIQLYNDQTDTGKNATSIGTNGAYSFQKLRFTLNESNVAYPLAGFYFDTVAGSNISSIDMSGRANVFNNPKESTTLVAVTDVSTLVSARKEKMNYVSEINDGTIGTERKPILLEQNDYIETGSVTVKSASGCSAGGSGDLVTPYAYGKGYFKSSLTGKGILFGRETDATSAEETIGSTDITGSDGTFYCTSASA